MEIPWEYSSILFLIKYSPTSFNIYSINYYCDGCQMVISNSVIPSTFVSWCLYYYKGLSFLLPFIEYSHLFVSMGSQTTDLSKWLYSTNIPVLTLSYLASGNPSALASVSFLSCLPHSYFLTQAVTSSSSLSYPQRWLSPRSFNSF